MLVGGSILAFVLHIEKSPPFLDDCVRWNNVLLFVYCLHEKAVRYTCPKKEWVDLMTKKEKIFASFVKHDVVSIAQMGAAGMLCLSVRVAKVPLARILTVNHIDGPYLDSYILLAETRMRPRPVK